MSVPDNGTNVVLLVLLALLAVPLLMMSMMFLMMGGMMGGMQVLGVVPLFALGVLVYAGTMLVRSSNDRAEPTVDADDAVEDLRRRYAEGELSEEELESRLESRLADDSTDTDAEAVTDRTMRERGD